MSFDVARGMVESDRGMCWTLADAVDGAVRRRACAGLACVGWTTGLVRAEVWSMSRVLLLIELWVRVKE